MRQINYKDKTVIKRKNARVIVHSLDKSEYDVVFKILDTNPETQNNPRADHKSNNGVVTTTVRISNEAAYGLMIALQEQLKNNGTI